MVGVRLLVVTLVVMVRMVCKVSSILGETTQYDIDDLAVTSSLFSNLTVGTGASNDLQQTAAFSTVKDYTVNCKLAIVLYNKNGGSTGSYMPVLEVFTKRYI